MQVTINGEVAEGKQVLYHMARWLIGPGQDEWRHNKGHIHFDIAGTSFTPHVQFDLTPIRAGAIAASILLALFLSVTHLSAPALAEPLEHALGISAGAVSDAGVTETFSSLDSNGVISEASDTSFGLPFESQRPAVPTAEFSPTPPITATILPSPTATALPSPTATAKPTATARPTRTVTAPTLTPMQAPTTEPTVAPASAPIQQPVGPVEKEKQDPPGQQKEPPGQEKNPSKPNPPDPPGQSQSPSGQGKR